jgi:RNA polymerase sigma-70 factor (ECF subfamily)
MGAAMVKGVSTMPGEQEQRSRSTSESNRVESIFESAFLTYYDRIVGILFRLLGDRARAEELANEAFLKLYRQSWLADSDGPVGGWLYRTSTNLGIDALRALARRQRYEEAAGRANTEAAHPIDPLQEVLREEQCRRVRSVLSALKSAHAQILILRATGLSYKELAESLGVKLGSVGTMLARAEAEFRERFLGDFGEEKRT